METDQQQQQQQQQDQNGDVIQNTNMETDQQQQQQQLVPHDQATTQQAQHTPQYTQRTLQPPRAETLGQVLQVMLDEVSMAGRPSSSKPAVADAATTTAAGAYYLFSRRTRTLSKRACHKAKDEAPILTSWGKEQGHTTLITEDS